jgi:NAD(P)H-quinone oxidoreductase subunit 4
MSGFVSEIGVFLGFASSDAYSDPFKVGVILLAAMGVILSPIYLLSMLRSVFYGAENAELTGLTDAKPREAFIALCLILPIVGIGLYPKLATQTYDAKTVAVTEEVRTALPMVAAQPFYQFSLPTDAPTIVNADVKVMQLN